MPNHGSNNLNQQLSVKAYFAKVTGRKLDLYNKKIVLPISVGQPYHEGESFSTTIQLLNSYPLKHCDVIVADCLQRHSLQLYNPSLTAESAYNKALLAGELWINRHRQEIDSLIFPHRILRWSQWLESDLYYRRRAEILQLIRKSEAFRANFEETVQAFISRYQNRTHLAQFSYADAFQACMNYVLEECTIMSLWVPNHYDFEVYPGKRIKAMALTHEYFVKPQAPTMLQWLRIHFKEIINPGKTEISTYV